MQKDRIALMIGLVLICGTVLGVFYNLQNTGITIKNTGSVAGSVQNSLTVSGEGKVQAVPDIVRINAGVSEMRKTTKAAQEAANEKLNQILSVLDQHDVPDENIQTTNLSFNTEYDWNDGNRKIRGQRVRQTLNVKIEGIDKDAERVTNILDALGSIDGLEMNSVNFDIDDKEALFSQARGKAFEKAEQKARELADLGDVKLLKPITISESNINYNPPIMRNFAMAKAVGGAGGGSALPSGELDITAHVNVVFGIE